MELHVAQIDMKKTRETWPRDRAFAPAYMFKQPTQSPTKWVVFDAPIVPGQPPSCAHTGHDQYVRIPVFEYHLSPQADLAFAYMLQLGLSCAGFLPAAVKKFFVVTGAPVDLLYDHDINTSTGLSYWFGLAVVTE